MQHEVESFVHVRFDVFAKGRCGRRCVRSMAEAIDDDEQRLRIVVDDAHGISTDGFPFCGKLSGSYIH